VTCCVTRTQQLAVPTAHSTARRPLQIHMRDNAVQWAYGTLERDMYLCERTRKQHPVPRRFRFLLGRCRSPPPTTLMRRFAVARLLHLIMVQVAAIGGLQRAMRRKKSLRLLPLLSTTACAPQVVRSGDMARLLLDLLLVEVAALGRLVLLVDP